jgi:hypothetical protein
LFTFSEIELAREFVDHSTLLVIFRNDYSTHDYQANIENIINELKANSIYQHIEKLIIWGAEKQFHLIKASNFKSSQFYSSVFS